MAKKVLAIDLGITTGYAVFILDNEEPVEYGEIAYEELGHRLTQIKLAHLVSYSVCERPVIIRGKLGSQLESALSTTRAVFDHQVRFVDPAQWKQTPFKSSPCPRGTSTHVKDSIRLGRWFMHSLKVS